MTLQETEVSEAKWVSMDELKEIIQSGEFVPGINIYFDLFKNLVEKYQTNNIDIKKSKETQENDER